MGADLFISDLHLSAAEPAVVEAFEAFVNGAARQAGSLIILGDLFEYWAGDDDLADPFNARVCALLKGLSEHGVSVRFMRGNRDFLVGEMFARAAGLALLEDPSVIDAGGERVLLMHGDTLCTGDAAYQAFRAQVRDVAWQAQFLAQPLAARKQLIMALREHSEAAKQGKAMSIMDVTPAAVKAALRAHGVSRLIHGHTHRPAHHRLTVDGRACERWVLADWCASPAYLRCEGGVFESVAIQ
jgi:UDP-2,3-diacylglucosamine hydrolase